MRWLYALGIIASIGLFSLIRSENAFEQHTREERERDLLRRERVLHDSEEAFFHWCAQAEAGSGQLPAPSRAELHRICTHH